MKNFNTWLEERKQLDEAWYQDVGRAIGGTIKGAAAGAFRGYYGIDQDTIKDATNFILGPLRAFESAIRRIRNPTLKQSILNGLGHEDVDTRGRLNKLRNKLSKYTHGTFIRSQQQQRQQRMGRPQQGQQQQPQQGQQQQPQQGQQQQP